MSSLFSAKLTRVRGSVAVRSGSKVQVVKTGEIVRNGQTIQTSGSGYAEVQFRDGSIIKVYPNSRYLIAEEASAKDKNPSKSMLISGSAGFELGSLNKLKKDNEKFILYTPTSVAGIRGTEFVVQNDKNGRSQMLVTEGKVAVAADPVNEKEALESADSLKAGKSYQSDKDEQIDYGDKVKLADSRWRARRQNPENPVPEPEYVEYYLELMTEIKNQIDQMKVETAELYDEGYALAQEVKDLQAADAEKAVIMAKNTEASKKSLRAFVKKNEMVAKIFHFRGYEVLLEGSGKTHPASTELTELLKQYQK